MRGKKSGVSGPQIEFDRGPTDGDRFVGGPRVALRDREGRAMHEVVREQVGAVLIAATMLRCERLGMLVGPPMLRTYAESWGFGLDLGSTLGKVSLGAYKAATKVIVSEELAADSSVSLDAYLAEELGLRISVLEGTAYVNGDGARGSRRGSCRTSPRSPPRLARQPRSPSTTSRTCSIRSPSRIGHRKRTPPGSPATPR